MNDSLADWLALREAADWTARSEPLARRVVDTLPAGGPVRVLDLGTGTGSNLRYLMDRLPMRQRWRIVDRDPSVLAKVLVRLSAWADARGYTVESHSSGARVRGSQIECDIEIEQRDLGRLDEGMFEGRHLVTASALLDLVSESWLRALAAGCRTAGASALFTITYNGESSCEPHEPEDEMVRELLNQHQLTDKGLGGPAAGPAAWSIAERCFADAGYHVEGAASDWAIGPVERTFQRQLIEGWADAAGELAPARMPAIASWLARRLGHLDAGRSRVIVSHRDMAAWLGRETGPVAAG